MTLPTRSNVQTLDYSGAGQPAAIIEAKALNSSRLDISQLGQPVIGIAPADAGAVTLLPPVLESENSFYSATATNLNIVLPEALESDTFVYLPTVSAEGGEQTLSASLLTNEQTFYGIVSVNENTLLPTPIPSDSFVYVPDLSATGPDQTVVAGLFTNAQVFYAATSVNLNTVLPETVNNDNSIYSATITTTGANQTLSASLLTNTTSFFGPSATNLNILSPQFFADSDFVFAPSVFAEGTEQSLSPSLLTNVSVFFAATVSGVEPQPILGGGSLVKPRRKFRPSVLPDFENIIDVQPEVSGKVILASLSVTAEIGSVIATSPDPMNSRAQISFTQIEAYLPNLVGRSGWNDPSDEELLFILDFALD